MHLIIIKIIQIKFMNNSFNIEINKNSYLVKPSEFKINKNYKFNNLDLLNNLDIFERLTGLLSEFSELGLNTCVFYKTSHGGFLPIQCSNFFENIFILNIDDSELLFQCKKNIDNFNIKNIHFNLDLNLDLSKCIVFSENCNYIDLDFIFKNKPIIISPFSFTYLKHKLNLDNYTIFDLSNSFFSILILNTYIHLFEEKFNHFIKNSNQLEYDNLINLCIMVKNAGPQFEEMLNSNLSLIDEWTILDTGSTDYTIDIINKVLIGKKRGNLYQEPFINFRDSRNRLIELAGQKCKFILMLDDTYTIKGNLRDFLREVRSDQFSDSFSLYVKSDDVEYCSNRIIKTDRNLKYKFKIHEIIQNENNNNVIIPIDEAFIFDSRFDYMEKRTMERKQLDIQLLCTNTINTF